MLISAWRLGLSIQFNAHISAYNISAFQVSRHIYFDAFSGHTFGHVNSHKLCVHELT